MKYYAVYDTNVLISSLLSKHSDSSACKVIDAIASQHVIPLYNEEILAEYYDVLHRKKFKFTEERINELITLIKNFGKAVSPSPTGEILPDMDDLVFYEVVMEKRNDDAYLITGNTKHFPVCDFIVTPSEMMKILERTGNQL